MRILVTGCMGFIGSNVVPALLRAGHDVIGLDNLSNVSIRPTDRMKRESGELWSRFRFYKADILEPALLGPILLNEKIECVVHLAAVGSVPRSFTSPMLTFGTNQMGFVTLLMLMSKFRITKLVYASSSSVYGDNNKNVKTEGEEGRCLSPYAQSKKMNEDFARVWCPHHVIQSIGLRFFNVYGPGQLVDSPYSAVIPKFINRSPTIFGDGLTTRDFTFVDDVADAITKAAHILTTTANMTEVVNVGTGNGTNLRQLLVLLGKTAKHEAERVGDIKYAVASTHHLQEVLGLRAMTPITEGIRRTKEFYEKENSDEQTGQPSFQKG